MPERNEPWPYYEEVPLEDQYLLLSPEALHQQEAFSPPDMTEPPSSSTPASKQVERRLEGDVLILGAGITGMQAALDIADKGYRAILVDRSATIGGNMVKLDKTFPTNDCSICTAAPKMVEVARQPNIELLTYSELHALEGEPGDFTARVYRRSGYVDPDKCKGCDDCVTVCPVELTSAFEEGLSRRKAIYLEFPQAVPVTYTIDIDACTGCGACERVCEAGAISFLRKSQDLEVKVGSLIVATGYELFEPLEMRREYGYGQYPNVISAIQFERLLSSFGPTEGKVMRPSDGQPARSIAWIQCVGSRSKQQGFPYCSRVCCMYATKEAAIVREMDPEVDTTIFYMDLRAYGKDFQQYYDKAREQGVNYVRGRPSSVYENEDGSISVRYLDTHTRRVHEQQVDLLVLSTAIIPNQDNPRLARILGIEADEYGFFQAASSMSDPLASSRPGVFLAGCVQGPKDIPDSVAMGSGAAARAMQAIIGRDRTPPPVKPDEQQVAGQKPKIGVFVCHCGKNINGFLDCRTVADYAQGLENVDFSTDVMFACSEDTQKEIREKIAERGLNRLIIAACSPITHGPLFQDTLEEAGLNKYLFDFTNIRQHCSWVHSHDREQATAKAQDLVRMSVAKSQLLEPLTEAEVEVTPRVLVIGGGLSGMKAALALAEMEIDTTLVEREAMLGGTLNRLYSLFPQEVRTHEVIDPLIEAVNASARITVHLGTTLEAVKGFVGHFQGTLLTPEGETKLTFGTAILATGFKEIDLRGRYGFGHHPRILTQSELETRLEQDTLERPRNIVMINCAGAMEEARPWCCRIGCGVSIKNARLLKQRYPEADLHLLYRDIRVFGSQEEEYFGNVLEECQINIIRYGGDRQPEVTIDEQGRVMVKVHDQVYQTLMELPTDLLVLTAQTEAHAANQRLVELFKIPTGPGGFFTEAHAKIRPLDFSTAGLYLCGASHFPKNLADSIAQAEGAASRAAIPMMKGRMVLEGFTAQVDEAGCSGCQLCVDACPYAAIEVTDEGKARVISALCKGCGLCAASCRSGAIQQQGFTDAQILTMIKSALQEVT